jgi:hypothetical protein
VALLNGPMDRPWGVRTASFTDPAGNVWEIAQPVVVPRRMSEAVGTTPLLHAEC